MGDTEPLERAIIKNLTAVDGTIEGSSATGIIAGYISGIENYSNFNTVISTKYVATGLAYATSGENAYIIYCFNAGSVDATGYAAGLVHVMSDKNAIIKNSGNTGNLSGKGATRTAGLANSFYSDKIEKSYNSGTLMGKDAAVIDGCFNSGLLTARKQKIV